MILALAGITVAAVVVIRRAAPPRRPAAIARPRQSAAEASAEAPPPEGAPAGDPQPPLPGAPTGGAYVPRTPEEHQRARDRVAAVATHPLHRLLAERIERQELDLPLLPRSAGQVLAMCSDPNVMPDEIAEVVQSDATLTAHVLRIANSVLYAPGQRITSLQLAIMRLGLETVKDITVSVTLQNRLLRGRDVEAYATRVLYHSTLASGFARALAPLADVDVSLAALAGLMHDVGRPALLQACRDLRAEMDQEAHDEVVELCVNNYHAEVAAELVRLWELPEELIAAVEHHHDGDVAEHGRLALVTALADEMAHWAEDPRADPSLLLESPLVHALELAPLDIDRVLLHRARVQETAAAYLV